MTDPLRETPAYRTPLRLRKRLRLAFWIVFKPRITELRVAQAIVIFHGERIKGHGR